MPGPSAALAAAIRAGECTRYWVFYLKHPMGEMRHWSGAGDLQIGAETYTGTQHLGSVNGVSDSAELQAHDVRVMLAGIPFDAAVGLTESVRGSVCKLWTIWLGRDGQIIGGPVLRFKGKASHLASERSADALVATLYARSTTYDLREAPMAYYSDPDQQQMFPGDAGCSGMADLINQSVSGWSPSVGGGGTVYLKWTNVGGFHLLDSGGRRVVTEGGADFTASGSAILFPGSHTTGYGTTTVLQMGVGTFFYREDPRSPGVRYNWAQPFRPLLTAVDGYCRLETNFGERIVVANDLKCYTETTGERVFPTAIIGINGNSNTPFSARQESTETNYDMPPLTTHYAKAIPV